ncbi:MAG: type II toxin-antitoxin system PemK/MazF family toxin [bacterium]|nr:type II toxin-antitoxin system PemK/MazF family toxin [bacterium]
MNVGFEQDGTGEGFSRPVLILKGFSRQVCLVVPLTTSTKKNIYHVSAGVVDRLQAVAIISQVRLIDTKRLYKQIGTLDKEVFENIRKAVKDML